MDEAVICIHCGCAISGTQKQHKAATINMKDKNILFVFFPLIYYIVVTALILLICNANYSLTAFEFALRNTIKMSIIFVIISVLWILANLYEGSQKQLYLITLVISVTCIIVIILGSYTHIMYELIPNYDVRSLFPCSNPNAFHYVFGHTKASGVPKAKSIITVILLEIVPIYTSYFSLKKIKN